MTDTFRIRLSRRTIMRTTGAGLGVAALSATSGNLVARAQDSTPDATPNAAGTPGASTSVALETTYPFSLPQLPCLRCAGAGHVGYDPENAP